MCQNCILETTNLKNVWSSTDTVWTSKTMFEVVGQKNVSTNQVFNMAREELYRQLTLTAPEIGEPFHMTEIFRILKEVPEVLDVVNVKIVNRAGSSYSNYSIDIDAYMGVEGRVLQIPQSVIWELKYESDITGVVR